MDASSRAGRRKAPRLSPLGPILCLALAALAGGCGIDTYTYYYPPTVSYTAPNMELSHNTSNSDPSLLGYDIYYRVFQEKTSADGVCAAIYAAANSSSSSPSGLLAQLVAGTLPGYSGYRFYKMANENGVDPTPLLKVDDGEDYRLTITTGDWVIYNVDTAADYIRARRTSSLTTANRLFYESSVGATWQSSDYDYSGDTISGSTTVYLVAFAVAYGFNLGASGPAETYSMPTVFRDPSSSYGAIAIDAH